MYNTATDSSGEQATSVASVVVNNSSPELTNISITPSAQVTSNTTLNCTVTVSDPDGETLTPSYSWANAGVTIGTGDTITLDSNMVQPTDTVTCTATVTDSYGATESMETSVTVDNTQPIIASVSITPGLAYNDDLLSCQATASDDDGQALTTTYTWSNTTQGTLLGSGPSISLDSTLANNTDTIECLASVSDSLGAPVSSATSIVLENRAPTTPTVTISPSSAYVDSVLTCSATGSSDPDADPVTYTYEWSLNGTPSSTATTFSGAFVAGDTVSCTITPADPYITGNTATATLIINNSAPNITNVTLSPDPAYVDDSITVTATATDNDGDIPIFNYQWQVDGNIVQTGTNDTLNSGLFVKTVVSVDVTATDGSHTSAIVTASLTIANTPPTAPAVSISPTNPVAQVDDILCSVGSTSTDIDNDTISYQFSWTVDGVNYTGATTSSTTSTIAAADTSAGEQWTCMITPNDGDDAGTAAFETVNVASDWDGAITFTTARKLV